MPATERYVRRVGRPAKEWVREVIGEVCALFGTMEQANAAAAQKSAWDLALSRKLGF